MASPKRLMLDATSGKTRAAERRRTRRLPVQKMMVLYSKDSWLSFLLSKPGTSAGLLDVGKLGMQILAQEALPAQTRYRFRISGTGSASRAKADFRGVVAWCRKMSGKDFFCVGIRFDRADPARAAAIDTWVKEHRFQGTMRSDEGKDP
ncbi:MAG: PilZ domain-containing protein [Planctomycetes bacterium]|nr:PilZ domain-containing protein [Planctomycetota bacterium]